MEPTATVRTQKQERVFLKSFTKQGKPYVIIATVRHDDDCGNGHNTFAITGGIWPARNGEKVGREPESYGCLHEEIAKHFPELAPLLKWHLCTTDGPMHYIANTLYHASENGPLRAWVYYTGPNDPLGIGKDEERLVAYVTDVQARKAEGKPGYRVKWNHKTIKVRDLAAARASAIWPEATDEELTAPGLEFRLQARLPGLMIEFRRAVESLGFTY